MNILYAISTKSNLERKTFCVKIAVDLFVRSWVEMKIGEDCEIVKLSTSSWGRELKYFARCCTFWLECVDLFVRSWVEMKYNDKKGYGKASTSSWGRELKLLTIASGGQTFAVDLFVRSWVEIHLLLTIPTLTMSTSSWGRELKWYGNWYLHSTG